MTTDESLDYGFIELTEKRGLYIEATSGGRPDLLDLLDHDNEGWILVGWRAESDIAARESVWIDPEGREHYGPCEKGFDRYRLNPD